MKSFKELKAESETRFEQERAAANDRREQRIAEASEHLRDEFTAAQTAAIIAAIEVLL